MELIPSDLLAEGTVLVAADGVAARQLESCVASRQAGARRQAWTGPNVASYQAWAQSLWLERPGTQTHQLLTGGQVRALWRRTVERSAVSARLIGTGNVVRWTMEAVQHLREWRVDVRQLRAGADDPDFAAFLDWAGAYRDALAQAGWQDPGDIELLLESGAPPGNPARRHVWADLDAIPSRAGLRARLQDLGHRIEDWRPPAIRGAARRVRLPDAAEEVRAAAGWAAHGLTRNPNAKLAIVVPDLDARRDAVHRTLEEALAPDHAGLTGSSTPGFTDLAGQPPDQAPLIGSALTAVELFSPWGRFGTFSRWLRSPFFAAHPREAASRARLEARLRLTLQAQLPFLEALRTGAFAERIRAEAPALAAQLQEAARRLARAPARATPTYWAGVWRGLLRQLSWQAEDPDGTGLAAWELALNELTLLTPVTGTIPLTQALSELTSALARPRHAGPSPLRGVFLLQRPEDIGPGYDGIWVAGLTDSRWPRPLRPNPLLPLAMQRAHSFPLASPAESLEHSRRATARLVQQAPEVVLSWPGMLYEYPAQPSPLILPYPQAAVGELTGTHRRRGARHLLASRPRETVADPVPPSPERRIRGGARALDLQSRCPLRAFLECRLGGTPLEPVRRGVSQRQRGMAAHRTMELLLRSLPSRADLERWPLPERRDRIAGAVARALTETLGQAGGTLGPLLDLEAGRLRTVADGLLAQDLRRGAFRVTALEQRLTVPVGRWELSCRVDRLDTLDETGTAVAIIDYKTGRRNRPTDWLRDRPRDVQLPLYTLAVGEAAGAAVIAVLRPDAVRYRGLWSRPEDFPDKPVPLPEGRTWARQLACWRERLEALAEELGAGDSRIFPQDIESIEAAFAPLSRVYEQVALARGWLATWSPE